MDPITPGVAGAVEAARATDPFAAEAAKVSSSLLESLLGPSAEVIGQEWADRLRRRNMTRLLARTEKHVAGSPDPGYVRPRAAASAFEAAQFADDEIVTEYLSGVLATGRHPDGGDDGGIPWSSLIARLSSVQLRIHFVLYSNFRQVFRGDADRTRLFDFPMGPIAIPLVELVAAAGLVPDELIWSRVNDALVGLKQEDLIGGFAYGDREFFNKRQGTAKYRWEKERRLETPFEPLLEVSATPVGVKLFMWGLGYGQHADSAYVDPNFAFDLVEPVEGVSTIPIDGVAYMKDYWREVASDDPTGPSDPPPGV